MAEIIDVPVLDLDLSSLQAEAEETGKTIKDLKQEIKEFRDSLEGVEIGSEEFKSALEQLTNAQNELKQATKSSLDVVEGSYNALTRQMAEMKAEWKNLNPATEEGQKRMAELGKQINDTNNKLKEMDASLGNYQRNVGNYGSAFEGVSMKIEGTTASFEKQVSTTQAALDSFQLIEGAMQTMGIQSEETEKVLRSVEGAMRFTQGLKSIKKASGGFKELGIATKMAELQQKLFGTTVKSTTVATNTATKATNTFKKALISTGIGALIVAIGLLIANFDKVLALFKNNASAADKAAESFNSFKTEVEDTARTNATELEIMGAKGATAMQLLQAEIGMTGTSLETLKNKSEELKKNLSDAKWWQFGLKKELKQQIEEVEGMIEETTDKQKELSEEVKVQQVKDAEDAKKTILKNLEESQKAVDKMRERLSKMNLSAPTINLRSLNDQLKKDIDETEEAFKRGAISYGEYLEMLALLDTEYVSNREKLMGSLIDGYNTELMTEEEKSLNDLNQWKEEQLKIWRDYRIEMEKTGTETDLAEFAKQEEEALGKINQIYKKKDEEIKQMVKDNAWQKIVDGINKELDELDKVRERAIEKLALTEVAIKKEFEGKKDNAITIDFKYNLQKEETEKLLETYQKQLKTLEEIDNKERERLQTLIKKAEEEGASAEIIEQYKIQLEQIGGEWDAVNQKVIECKENIKNIELEELKETIAAIGGSFNQLGDAISKIAELGPGLGESFGPALAESMQAVGSTITQAGNDFEKLKKMLEEGAEQTQISAQKWKTYGNMAATGLGVAANLLDALAKQQEATSKEGFEQQKKLQIATATMAMLQGIVSSWSSAMSLPAPASFIVGGAMTAATAALGGVQIAAIKKQKFDGSTSVPDVAKANIPTPSALNSISPAVQTVNAVEGASVESNIKDTRVYVVETDIANTMNKVNVIESEATY